MIAIDDAALALIQYFLCSLYSYPHLKLYCWKIWILFIFILQISIGCLKIGNNKTPRWYYGAFGFTFCIIIAVITAAQAESFWQFAVFSLILLSLIALQYIPEINLENKGYGGLLRLFTHGFLLIELNSITITGEISFKLFLDMIPTHLLYQNWKIIFELCAFSEDIKAKTVTTAVLLGRHECYRLFVVLNLFIALYTIIDIISYGSIRGLTFLLLPWLFSQILRLRNMKLKRLENETFWYMLIHNFLTVITLVYS
ncbi:unnamed protein product [Blepharisma stoltei]|uniref:Uncharacterized protein n=1 Tax=Blepharisma stoltei TaxID=1481888 RepID=A0AAU9KCX8_9CILI|nr:unnamed protein product [Blepharisma stoltei]